MIVRRLTAFAALLIGAGLVLGQGGPGGPKKDAPPKAPAKPAAGSLEDTLEKALRNSADIRSAEAKVREAEAELNRVRQQVLTRATAVHSDLKLAKRMLAVAEQSRVVANNRIAKVGPDGNTDAIQARTDAILAAEAMLEKHRGEIEKLETELKSLRGEFALKYLNMVDGMFEMDGTVRLWDVKDAALLSGELVDMYLKASKAAPKAPAVQGSMAERVRKLLDQEVDFEIETRPVEALRELMDAAKSDIPVRVLLGHETEGVVALKGKLPVGAWMQAIEDSDPKVAIVVRDYGLFLTMKDRVPAGAVGVSELWKMKKADPKGPEKQ